MSQDEPTGIIVRTGPRQPAPALPRGKIVLAPPPPSADEQRRPPALRVSLFVTTVVALLAAGIALFADLSSGARTAAAVTIFGLIALQYLAYWLYPWVRRGFGRQPRRMQARRAQYLRYVVGLAEELRAIAQQQRHALLWRQPDPERLAALVDEQTRVWDHRPGDIAFLISRVAVGPQTLCVELVLPRTAPVEDLDQGTANALRELVAQHGTVPDLPIAVDLTAFTSIVVTGDLEAARGLVRTLLCQAMVFHGPDDLIIEPAATGKPGSQWGWLDGAAHLPPGADARTPALRIRVLEDGHPPAWPSEPPSGTLQICVSPSAEPPAATEHLVFDVSPARLTATTLNDVISVGTPDYLSSGEARGIVRRLSRLRLGPPDDADAPR